MARVTQYRADPDLVDMLVREQLPHAGLDGRRKGIRFQPSYGRQAFKVDGRFRFWGGLAVEAWGGGQGLVEGEHKACRRRRAWTCTTRRRRSGLLVDDDGAVRGVRARHEGRTLRRAGRAVVLAAGGFESNAEWRARYLGPNWDLAKVRGTRFNTGRRDPHGARGRGAAPRPLVGLPRRGLGPELAPPSATWRWATASRSTPIRSASWSTPGASASSTRAPTSATTPTPATAR